MEQTTQGIITRVFCQQCSRLVDIAMFVGRNLYCIRCLYSYADSIGLMLQVGISIELAQLEEGLDAEGI